MLGNFVEEYRLFGDIDEKDTPFVALALELEGELWMMDETLKIDLKRKGFNSFFGWK
jgi:predicted nucleic acid-binding protein